MMMMMQTQTHFDVAIRMRARVLKPTITPSSDRSIARWLSLSGKHAGQSINEPNRAGWWLPVLFSDVAIEYCIIVQKPFARLFALCVPIGSACRLSDRQHGDRWMAQGTESGLLNSDRFRQSRHQCCWLQSFAMCLLVCVVIHI